ELVVGRAEDGTRWATTIAPDGPTGAAGALEAPDEPLRWPSTFTVRSEMDPADWCALVERAARATAGPDLDKVVLAREVTVTTDRPIDRLGVLARLRAGYPGCHLVS